MDIDNDPKPITGPPEQRCFNELPGRPCEICMDRRTGKGKACYKPFEKSLPQRLAEKHGRKMKRARRLEAEARE